MCHDSAFPALDERRGSGAMLPGIFEQFKLQTASRLAQSRLSACPSTSPLFEASVTAL